MPDKLSEVKFMYASTLPYPSVGGDGVDPNTIYFLPNDGEIRVGEQLIASDYTLRYLKENRNNIYRGHNLGTEVTAEQWESIKNGTFDDMYIGDYWILNNCVYEIGAFNYPSYYRRASDSSSFGEGDNHLTLVGHRFKDIDGESPILMNSERTTEGGFLGSRIYTELLPYINTNILIPTFTASHLLSTMVILTNAVDSETGDVIGTVYTYDDISCIPDEIMAYGTRHCSLPTASAYRISNGHGQSSQLPLYRFRHAAAYRSTDGSLKYMRKWLRDPASNKTFTAINNYGDATKKRANDTQYSYGIDVIFAVY